MDSPRHEHDHPWNSFYNLLLLTPSFGQVKLN
jgi:hypothetical protein